MFLVGLISWWYGRGWLTHLYRVGGRFKATLEFFSVGQLMATLFSPFRQISAGPSGDASFGGAVRAFFDQLLSRVIGATIRFFTIIFGLIAIALQSVYEGIVLIIWWLLPLLPIIGFIAVAIGWVPTWR
jgi:hypothetical protein